MNTFNDSRECFKWHELIGDMTLHEEYRENEFDLDWLRRKGWIVVPTERAQHFTLDEISTMVSALNKRGFVECVAVATEPLEPLPTCYTMAVTEKDFNAFNQECGLFRFLLTDHARSWAVSCSESYNLFAGPPDLVEDILGNSVADAWRSLWGFLDQSGIDPSGSLRQTAKRYLSLLEK